MVFSSEAMRIRGSASASLRNLLHTLKGNGCHFLFGEVQIVFLNQTIINQTTSEFQYGPSLNNKPTEVN